MSGNQSDSSALLIPDLLQVVSSFCDHAEINQLQQINKGMHENITSKLENQIKIWKFRYYSIREKYENILWRIKVGEIVDLQEFQNMCHFDGTNDSED